MKNNDINILGFNISISVILIYSVCILKGKLSYNEELLLCIIYIVLFWIFYFNSKNVIRNLIIEQTFNLNYFYEKIFYLKMNLLIKEESFLIILKNKEFVKNNLNLLNLVVKKNLNLYIINNKSKLNKILLLSYLLLLSV